MMAMLNTYGGQSYGQQPQPQPQPQQPQQQPWTGGAGASLDALPRTASGRIYAPSQLGSS